MRACLVACIAVVLASTGCERAESTPARADVRPAAEDPGGRSLSALSFPGVREDGRDGVVAVDDYRDAVLVVRVHGGEWCGTCRWHAQHTGELLAIDPRVHVLDVVVGNRDNDAADVADARSWRTLLDDPSRVAVGVDPSFRLADVAPNAPLPLVLTVDPRTQHVRAAASNPDSNAVLQLVREGVTALDGAPAPSVPDEPLVDDRFHRNEWDLVRAMADLGEPPADPSNAASGNAGAIALGKAIFADRSLSPSGTVACVTCHDFDRGLADGEPRARGMGVGARRTPRIALAAYARWQFWDGRADSLWAQALGPFENPLEFGSSRLFVVRRIAETYAGAYRAAFPDAPLPDVASLPREGKPGDASFDGLPAPTRDDVTRVFVNVGKAVAAYEATFRVEPNALDAYARGNLDALTSTQKLGLCVFMTEGCPQCHWGPRLTDDAFHVTGAEPSVDPGRSRGIADLLASDFQRSGRWSDAVTGTRRPPASTRTVGAFKTPPLRGVAGPGPYGHGGSLRTLAEVTERYGRPPASSREPWLPAFGETAEWALVPFLETLTARPIVR